MAAVTKGQWALGAVALTSVALLGYALIRPTKEQKKRKGKKKKGPKTAKYEHRITKLPIDINLVMSNFDAFHAHVAGDKKNKKLGLKFGSRLFKINDKKVENLPYEEIMQELLKKKPTITLSFKEFPELEANWEKAEQYREKSNDYYKNGETQKGIEECSKAIQLHPTNKVYYSNRILMYLKSGQLEAALEDCQKIRELDPLSLYVKGHYLRGLVLVNLGKIKNAAAAFQTVMKLEPEFKQAKVRLDDCLKKLKVEEEKEEAKTNEKRRSSETQMKAKMTDPNEIAAAVASVKAESKSEGENLKQGASGDVENAGQDENKTDITEKQNENDNQNSNENDKNIENSENNNENNENNNENNESNAQNANENANENENENDGNNVENSNDNKADNAESNEKASNEADAASAADAQAAT